MFFMGVTERGCNVAIDKKMFFPDRMCNCSIEPKIITNVSITNVSITNDKSTYGFIKFTEVELDEISASDVIKMYYYCDDISATIYDNKLAFIKAVIHNEYIVLFKVHGVIHKEICSSLDIRLLDESKVQEINKVDYRIKNEAKEVSANVNEENRESLLYIVNAVASSALDDCDYKKIKSVHIVDKKYIKVDVSEQFKCMNNIDRSEMYAVIDDEVINIRNEVTIEAHRGNTEDVDIEAIKEFMLDNKICCKSYKNITTSDTVGIDCLGCKQVTVGKYSTMVYYFEGCDINEKALTNEKALKIIDESHVEVVELRRKIGKYATRGSDLMSELGKLSDRRLYSFM